MFLGRKVKNHIEASGIFLGGGMESSNLMNVEAALYYMVLEM
jgi:hypothetical protein